MSTSLKELIQKITEEGMPSIVVGTVTRIDPIRITLANDTKINLSSASVIIPNRHNPIKKGEKFYLLSLSKHKIYYLLDRM